MHNNFKMKQLGAAVMLTMFPLLIISSLIIVTTIQSVKTNALIVRNQLEAQKAFEAAESGLEYGTAYLLNNYQSIIVDKSENSGFGDGFIDKYLSSLLNDADNGNNTYFNVSYTNTTANNLDIIEITSKGSSDSGMVEKTITEKIARIKFGSVTPQSSLITMGNVSLGGNATITNTVNNHTIWAGGNISLSGSASTQASNGIKSNSSTANIDLSSNDPQISSLTKDQFFNYMLGSDKSSVESHASTVLNYSANQKLSSILSDSSYEGKSIWINQTAGTASLSGSATIGSTTKPVFLVINGDFKANGNTEIYGIVYITQDWKNTGGGNLTVHGAIIVEGDMSSTGSPNIDYDFNIISETINIAIFSKVPGSWRDF